MATQLDIVNMALDYLEEEYAIDENEDRPAVKLMQRNFSQARDVLLRKFPWNFAMKEDALSSPVTRTTGWKYEYTLPADCLRLMPIRYQDQRNGRPVDYELRARKIYTNEPTKIYIRYVRQVTDTADMTDPLFVEALALALALRCCHAITRKNSYTERISQLYAQALQDAGLIDSLEGSPEDARGDYWDDMRSTGPL